MRALDSNSVAGDLFNMSRALKLPIEQVAENAVILIPLFTTDDSVAMNSDSLANGPILYVKLDGPPQPRAVFGTIAAYSESADNRELNIGSKIRFPPSIWRDPYSLCELENDI